MAPAAWAQMFHLYLNCTRELQVGNQSRAAEIDLALRDNNQTALIRRSDVLPVGERMAYLPSQTHYAMVYATPVRSSRVYVSWYRRIVVWWPDFERVVTTRLSIDRQTGQLQGEILDGRNDVLARLQMNCEPTKDADAPAPRF